MHGELDDLNPLLKIEDTPLKVFSILPQHEEFLLQQAYSSSSSSSGGGGGGGGSSVHISSSKGSSKRSKTKENEKMEVEE